MGDGNLYHEKGCPFEFLRRICVLMHVCALATSSHHHDVQQQCIVPCHCQQQRPELRAPSLRHRAHDECRGNPSLNNDRISWPRRLLVRGADAVTCRYPLHYMLPRREMLHDRLAGGCESVGKSLGCKSAFQISARRCHALLGEARPRPHALVRGQRQCASYTTIPGKKSNTNRIHQLSMPAHL